MGFTAIDNGLWFCATCLNASVLVFLIRRGLAGQLALLTCYVSLQFVFAFEQFLPISRQTYAIIFWTGQILTSSVGLLLVYSFWKLGLARYRGFHRLCSLVSGITVAILIGILATASWGAAASAEPNQWLNRWFFQVTRSISFVSAGLMTAFFFFLGSFRIQLSRTVRNVALAWFCFVLVRVPLQAWGAASGNLVLVGRLRLATFVILSALWSAVVWHHQEGEAVETAPIFAMHVDRQQLAAQMDSMNRSLIRLLQVRG